MRSNYICCEWGLFTVKTRSNRNPIILLTGQSAQEVVAACSYTQIITNGIKASHAEHRQTRSVKNKVQIHYSEVKLFLLAKHWVTLLLEAIHTHTRASIGIHPKFVQCMLARRQLQMLHSLQTTWEHKHRPAAPSSLLPQWGSPEVWPSNLQAQLPIFSYGHWARSGQVKPWAPSHNDRGSHPSVPRSRAAINCVPIFCCSKHVRGDRECLSKTKSVVGGIRNNPGCVCVFVPAWWFTVTNNES